MRGAVKGLKMVSMICLSGDEMVKGWELWMVGSRRGGERCRGLLEDQVERAFDSSFLFRLLHRTI